MWGHLFLPLLYCLPFFRSFPSLWEYFFFAVGVSVGWSLLWVDRLVHAFYLYPETEFNQLLRHSWQQRQYRALISALMQAGSLQEKLLMRSTLFFLVYLALTVFVLTSTGSVFGIGLMLGMGLHYTYDFWRYSRQPDQFQRHFWWQIRRHFTARQVQTFVWAWTFFFVILSFLVLW